MLTREKVIELFHAKKAWPRGACHMIDCRDLGRLVNYFPVDQWSLFGMALKEGAAEAPVKEWTEANVIDDLKTDVAFGFEKALNKRGISASLMHEVVQMWLWVLEVPVPPEARSYPQYGLPLLKFTALHFGFPNPVGGDEGDEPRYSEEG